VVVWDFCSECYSALVVGVIAGAGVDSVALGEAAGVDLVVSAAEVQAAAELVAVGSW
jgi:hypothetical protein